MITNPFSGWTEPDKYHQFRPAYHHLPMQKLKVLLGEISNVLDVACGTGQATAELAKIAKNVTGCDVSEEMLAEARRHLAATFVCAPAEKLPFADSSFDLVNISMGFHWLSQEQFLKEAFRVLRPTGFLSVDCYGCTQRMVGRPEFEIQVRDFYQRNLPLVQRRNLYPDETQLVDFRLEAEIPYDHLVPMTAYQFAEFIKTQSNFICLPDRKKTEVAENLNEFCQTYFLNEKREMTFAGELRLYRTRNSESL